MMIMRVTIKIPEINIKNIKVNNLYSENVHILKETINIFLKIIRTEIIPKIKNSHREKSTPSDL